MNTKGFSKKAAGAVASLALIAGGVAMTGSPVAADPGDVGLEILDGDVSASLAEVNFGQVERSLTETQKPVGGVTLTVEDSREDEDGWDIFLTNSPLVGPNPGSIDADDVTVTSVGSIVAGNGTVTSPQSEGPMDDLHVLAAGEDNGAGVSTAQLAFNVNVPPSLPVGAYEGTIAISYEPTP